MRQERDVTSGGEGLVPAFGGAERQAPETSAAGAAADARSLRGSMVTNVLGALPKLLYPLLLVFVVRAYGKSAFGLYTLLEATVYFALYLVTLGLDKGLLWWIPRRPPGEARTGLPAVWLAVAVAAALGTAALWLGGHLFVDLERVPPGARAELGVDLAWMAAGLAPLVFMQMFVHASLARRHLGAQVWVREALVSLVLTGAALCFAALGRTAHGLAWSFALSNAVGCAAAWVLYRRHFRDEPPRRTGWRLPPPLVAFALPLWLTGLVASLMARADLYWLALLTDTATIGLYAGVLQLGKAVRSAHTSFGHMVVAYASEITAVGLDEDSLARLVRGFSQATRLVLRLLVPLAVFLVVFARPLLELFGPGFSSAAPGAVVLCACWAAEGVLGLHGQVLMGLGKTRWGLFNMIAGLAVETVALLVLVPRLGLTGAAAAVGGASLAQNALQMIQIRVIFGRWLYARDCLRVLLHAGSALSMAIVVFVLLGEQRAWAARVLAVSVLGLWCWCTSAFLSEKRGGFAPKGA